MQRRNWTADDLRTTICKDSFVRSIWLLQKMRPIVKAGKVAANEFTKTIMQERNAMAGKHFMPHAGTIPVLDI